MDETSFIVESRSPEHVAAALEVLATEANDPGTARKFRRSAAVLRPVVGKQRGRCRAADDAALLLMAKVVVDAGVSERAAAARIVDAGVAVPGNSRSAMIARLRRKFAHDRGRLLAMVAQK